MSWQQLPLFLWQGQAQPSPELQLLLSLCPAQQLWGHPGQRNLVQNLSSNWDPKPCEPLTGVPSAGGPCAQLCPRVSLEQIPCQEWDKAPLSLGNPRDSFSNLPRLRLPSPLLKADQEAWGS